MLPRTLVILATALVCGAMAGCGASATLPGGQQVSIPASISVPAVSLPGIPGIDLSKTDPASAKKAICTASDLWLKADTKTKEALRPAVVDVINHYKTSTDQVTREAAQAGEQLLAADSQPASTKRSDWKQLCGTT